jgi:predicted dehydrogenase
MTTSSERPLGFGVVGLGSYVARAAVIPAIRSSPHAELVAVSTTTGPRDDFELLEGERLTLEADELLTDSSIDVIYLPLPNDLHLDYIQRSLDAGKHVLCEKPIVTTSSELEALTALINGSTTIVSEAFMTAYHTRVNEVIAMALSQRFGEIISISSTFTGRLEPLSGYRTSASKGGGSLWDIGIYALYPVVEIFGSSPQRVALSSIDEFDPPIDTTFEALLTYSGGHSAHVRTSFTAGESQRLEIVGTDAIAVVERASTPTVDDRTIEVTAHSGERELVIVDGCNPYEAMINEVSLAFKSSQEPRWTSARSHQMTELLLHLSAAVNVTRNH